NQSETKQSSFSGLGSCPWRSGREIDVPAGIHGVTSCVHAAGCANVEDVYGLAAESGSFNRGIEKSEAGSESTGTARLIEGIAVSVRVQCLLAATGSIGRTIGLRGDVVEERFHAVALSGVKRTKARGLGSQSSFRFRGINGIKRHIPKDTPLKI